MPSLFAHPHAQAQAQAQADAHAGAAERSPGVVTRRLALAAIGGSLLSAHTAHAQPAALPVYPTRAVHLLVANTPTSAADVIARYVAQRMGDNWKQTFVVENKPGAGGIVAADTVAKSAPDGYTLLLGADGPITILPSLQADLPYQPQRDLAPVAALGEIDFVLVANPKTGFRSVKDFVDAARRQPGRYNFASAGNGSPQQFAMELLKQQAGVFATHIPYRAGPPGMLDVVAGQVDLMFIAIGPALPHIKAGRLVALGVGGDAPHPLLPGVPTIDETYKGYRAGTWFGLFAPAGTPALVIDALADQARAILSTPAAQAEMAAQGIRATGYPPARFAALVRSEATRYAMLAKRANIKVD